jgi:hypothetical protein
VKILLDECLPRFLKKALVEHEVQTVQEAGWSGRRMANYSVRPKLDVDAFLTSDQNISYQQNLSGRSISLILLPNTLSVVKTLVPEILKALGNARPGDFLQIKV